MKETPVDTLFAVGLRPPKVAEVTGVQRQSAWRWQAKKASPRRSHQARARAYLSELRERLGDDEA